MSALVEARGLTKRFGSVTAVDNAAFTIDAGRIVGLIGPNGAGKTTLLRALLGLTHFDGELNVIGYDPRSQRPNVMENVCFIADVATLPRWMRVEQVLEFVESTHPNFSRARCEELLKRTEILPSRKVGVLSKGMVTQLHLAIVMAIDVKLLVLDEPTIGLDILFRRDFYDKLLADYFNEDRTIIITTHQVEEIQHILTHIMFINHGQIVLDESMEEIGSNYTEVLVPPGNEEKARALGPVHERPVFGKQLFLFEGKSKAELDALGETHTPSVADLFVAKMRGMTS